MTWCCPACQWWIHSASKPNIPCPQCGATIGELPAPANAVTDAPIPYDNWPRWSKLIAKRRIDTDVGVGDTVKRYADRAGGERFERTAKLIGIPCGCTARRENWNRLYPYAD